ncbi:MAG: PH domain-containing protein, partial [Gemmataceae bacterium]
YALIVGPEGLDCRSPWRRRIVMPWMLVESVRYAPINAWYVIRFTGGGRFHLPAIVPGSAEFLKLFAQYKTPGT